MLHVRWQGITERGHSKAGVPLVETFSTTKDVSVALNDQWLIIHTVTGNELLLSVPTWRIIDVSTD